jgi:VWFA-related protein
MQNLIRFSLSLGLLLLAVPANAQGDIILRADRADADQFPAVQVDVTIRDLYGVPVQDLTADEFTVSEDHDLEPRPIAGVETIVNPDLPIAVVVVLDVSGSMQGPPLEDAKVAAARFLDRMAAGDRAALIAFAGTVDLEAVDAEREHSFSNDVEPLYTIVEALQAGDHTPLYDVAYKAVRWAAAEPEGNRAVLLLSDGKEDPGPQGDKGSMTANEDTAIREANRANVPVFTIGLGTEIDEPYLRRLAIETGGRYQKAPDSASLVELFQNVADLLKQQMRITYESAAPADGQEHTVRVEVRAHERVASDETAFLAPLLEAEALPTPTLPPPQPEDTPTPPSPTPTVVPTVTVTAPPPDGPLGGPLLPWLLGLGGLALVLVLGGLGIRRFRRPKAPPVPRCLQCGRELEAADAPCPSCGYQGSFEAKDS